MFCRIFKSFKLLQAMRRGYGRNQDFPLTFDDSTLEETNPLEEYFDAKTKGNGIWKWRHYFEIYHRHFQKFVGRNVNVLEIGIFSGGSLDMWQSYFGPSCTIFGCDIEERCRVFEADNVNVFIGDQADRQFWQNFKHQVPKIDIVIDDGGHKPIQQIITMEELLPHIQPGGVYLCEDIHGVSNEFNAYVGGFTQNLHSISGHIVDLDDNERRSVVPTTQIQRAIDSIHIYPYVTVIEKRSKPLDELVAAKHGTRWEPFLSSKNASG